MVGKHCGDEGIPIEVQGGFTVDAQDPPAADSIHPDPVSHRMPTVADPKNGLGRPKERKHHDRAMVDRITEKLPRIPTLRPLTAGEPSEDLTAKVVRQGGDKLSRSKHDIGKDEGQGGVPPRAGRQHHCRSVSGNLGGVLARVFSKSHGELHGVRDEEHKANGIAADAHGRREGPCRGAADHGTPREGVADHLREKFQIELACCKQQLCLGDVSSQSVPALPDRIGCGAFRLNALGMSNDDSKHDALPYRLDAVEITLILLWT